MGYSLAIRRCRADLGRLNFELQCELHVAGAWRGPLRSFPARRLAARRRSRWTLPPFAERILWNTRCCFLSLRLCAGELDNFGPLLRFFGDEFAEICRRAWEHRAAEISKPAFIPESARPALISLLSLSDFPASTDFVSSSTSRPDAQFVERNSVVGMVGDGYQVQIKFFDLQAADTPRYRLR